jgi:hypothetical protein
VCVCRGGVACACACAHLPAFSLRRMCVDYHLISSYGPDVSDATYKGGYLSRFSPALSFWDSSVPSGLSGVEQAVAASEIFRLVLSDLDLCDSLNR